jgi:hypothetical protein
MDTFRRLLFVYLGNAREYQQRTRSNKFSALNKTILKKSDSYCELKFV